MEIFVIDGEWNDHWNSVDEAMASGLENQDYAEGDEFKMVRLTVGACTTYRIVGGKPIPVAVAFPDPLPPNPQ